MAIPTRELREIIADHTIRNAMGVYGKVTLILPDYQIYFNETSLDFRSFPIFTSSPSACWRLALPSARIIRSLRDFLLQFLQLQLTGGDITFQGLSVFLSRPHSRVFTVAR
jgi:hypothetical protein